MYPGDKAIFILRGVSFNLKAGEKVALMGANGSGKTTFVRCLNGLFSPTEGEVLVDDISTSDNRMFYDIRQRVGMVFQNPDNQIVATTVEREIAFGLENLGISQEIMIKRVENALVKFHLEDYRFASPHLLSGGERQQLALASVWVMEPDYLILDEPTSLLDPRGREEILRFIETEVKTKNIGVLLVTQYPEEAMICDRLVIMDKGKIVIDDHPEKVFQKAETLRRLGVDIPAEVELKYFMGGKDFVY
jgi:energy-coupling factor transport system ATP-binding protein